MLLRRRLEGAQTADLLENTLGIQLVFQPLQCAIDRFTFTNDHFWHQSSLLTTYNLLSTGEPEPTRAGRPRQITCKTPPLGERICLNLSSRAGNGLTCSERSRLTPK